MFALSVRNGLRVYFAASFKDSENGHFACGPVSSLAFALSTEVAFIDFKLAKILSFIGFFLSYDFSKPMKVVGGCGFVYANQ